MLRVITFALIFGLVGLVIGYFFFGKIGDDYIELSKLFRSEKNIFISIGNAMLGIEHIRWNIILTGLLSASAGMNVALTLRRF